MKIPIPNLMNYLIFELIYLYINIYACQVFSVIAIIYFHKDKSRGHVLHKNTHVIRLMLCEILPAKKPGYSLKPSGINLNRQSQVT